MASVKEQTSLGLWLQSHEARALSAETAKPAGDQSSSSDGRTLLALLAACESLSSPSTALANAPTLATHEQKDLAVPYRQAQPSQEVVQHISSLKLHIWMDVNHLNDILTELTDSFMTLWGGMQVAHISELTLGEFVSHAFCHISPSLLVLHSSSPSLGLTHLQSLTLHFNIYGMHDMFRPKGCLAVLRLLTVLKSLIIKASEVDVNGERKKQQVPADLLLTSLPASIQSLSLHNFRDRWQGFGDLSGKPGLVSLDLTQSSCIFPKDPRDWTQLHQLKLNNSVVWLQQGQPFLFNALTQLTQLDLGDCYFATVSPGQIGNTHHHVYRNLQVPSSIASLNLCTRSIQVSFCHAAIAFSCTVACKSSRHSQHHSQPYIQAKLHHMCCQSGAVAVYKGVYLQGGKCL